MSDKNAATGFFARLSLTTKLAAIIIVANLVGLGATVYFLQRSAGFELRQSAFENWEREVEQIGEAAAGGVKWGVPEAIQQALSIYTTRSDHDLRQVIAFNADREPVMTWAQDGFDKSIGASDIDFVMKKSPTEPVIEDYPFNDGKVTIVAPLSADSEGKPRGYIATVWSTASLNATGSHFGMLTLITQAISLLVMVSVFLFAMRRVVARPLDDLTGRIARLQEGDLASPVAHQQRADAIGVVARALEGFRIAAEEKEAADHEAERQRQAFETERSRNEQMTTRNAEVQARAVSALGDALGRLAGGDLTVRVDDLGPEFEKLRSDFNDAVETLQSTLGEISRSTDSVRGSAAEIAAATDDLSRRTEQQAASLEETSAALDEITATVRNSAESAAEAGKMVADAKNGAKASAEVVREAISAMERIEQSSSQIGQIIGVIDDIAFQTNLLALNAGVEAARAGDAGKGFAVVAQEVRELAQRSANAAREIKQLISNSAAEVGAGVSLVNRTGTALEQIEKQVALINDHIANIVTASREQSTGIAEVNTAVNQMDQMTQQNAAMVEQTNAACQGLTAESTQLKALVGRFAIGGGASAASGDFAIRHHAQAPAASPAKARPAPAAASAGARPAPSPARSLGRKLASAFGGSRGAATQAVAAEDDGWSEF